MRDLRNLARLNHAFHLLVRRNAARGRRRWLARRRIKFNNPAISCRTLRQRVAAHPAGGCPFVGGYPQRTCSDSPVRLSIGSVPDLSSGILRLEDPRGYATSVDEGFRPSR
jgi:hypothetical protein